MEGARKEELLEVKSEEEAVSDGVRRRVEIDIGSQCHMLYQERRSLFLCEQQTNKLKI